VSVVGGIAHALWWAAFDRLRTGHPARVSDLAATLHIEPSTVEAAAADLASAGLLEQDPSGDVVGANGLTLLATRHRLVLDGVELYTWCALDAIGIPAALGVDADLTTTCGWCERARRVHVESGVPFADAAVVLWLPPSACANLRDEFCSLANLFCDRDHLESWRRSAGGPGGEARTVEQVADLGREWWSRSPARSGEAWPPVRR
jgi:alkylmercury lyase